MLSFRERCVGCSGPGPQEVGVYFFSRISCLICDGVVIDFAELNAPPMINYGVVYPQAILMFVITMLYSVQQPLIVIFGAVYFGVGYVVYKYKLLFGMFCLSQYSLGNLTLVCSILQTLRITRSSLADHIHTTHLGRYHLSPLHDWYLHPP